MSVGSKFEKIVRDIKRKCEERILFVDEDIIELYNEMATKLAV